MNKCCISPNLRGYNDHAQLINERTPRMYPCPCCGYLVFDEPPGSYFICPICNWEDDLSQLRFVQMGGANVNLIQAQKNFIAFGASEDKARKLVRAPNENDQRDKSWRTFDLELDPVENPVSGIDYGNSYPEDPTTLYYWSPKFWKRELA